MARHPATTPHIGTRPEESCERLQDFWQAIYRTALSVSPAAVVELCSLWYVFHNMPAMNQSVASDPVIVAGAFEGQDPQGAHGSVGGLWRRPVELSGGATIASTVGIGAVVSTKFTWPADPRPENGLLLTPAKETEWRRWIALYKEKRLPEGGYRGELYIAFDRPKLRGREGRTAVLRLLCGSLGRPDLSCGHGAGRYSLVDSPSTWTARHSCREIGSSFCSACCSGKNAGMR